MKILFSQKICFTRKDTSPSLKPWMLHFQKRFDYSLINLALNHWTVLKNNYKYTENVSYIFHSFIRKGDMRRGDIDITCKKFKTKKQWHKLIFHLWKLSLLNKTLNWEQRPWHWRTHYGGADLKHQGFKRSQYIIFGKYTSGMFQFGLSILKHGFN